LVLLDDWFSIPVEIKLSSNLMRIEIVFLYIEWSRYFTLFIQFILLEHCLSIQVIDHITSLFINKIASLICHSPVFVSELTILILSSENVALLITLKFTKDKQAAEEAERLRKEQERKRLQAEKEAHEAKLKAEEEERLRKEQEDNASDLSLMMVKSNALQDFGGKDAGIECPPTA
jgi:signal transduction histidine kinase